MVSAEEGSVELLAALVYSERAELSPIARGTRALPLRLDGPGVSSNPGVGDPESSLGVGAMLGPPDVRVLSGVPSNTWLRSGVTRGGEDVREIFGVSGMTESLCYGRMSNH